MPHRVEFTRERITEFEKLYDTGWRQIYRWVERGRKCGKPCPLHKPKEMPIWWAQTSHHTCPAKILHAARSEDPSVKSKSSPHNEPTAEEPLDSIDLDSIDPDKVDAVKFQRALVGSLQATMRKKTLGRQSIDFEQPQYLKAVKALRDLERDDRESKAHRGEFIPRDIVERDAAVAAGMLRDMHPVMERRVLERCPHLPVKHRPDVLNALRYVFAAQARIFQRIDRLSSSDPFLAELAAA